jgi:hypothetical protein
VLLDRERDRKTSPTARVRAADATVDEPEPPTLRCAACGHRITDDAYRIEMSGSHEHTFVNPGGFVHHIGCFHPAPGCVYYGPTETAFSWFPGWMWQLANCASCHVHVGWIYRNAGQQFHGLILTALRRA